LGLGRCDLVALRGRRSKLDFTEVKRHACHAAWNTVRRRQAARIRIRFHGAEPNHRRSFSFLCVRVPMRWRNNSFADNSKTRDGW
jgi:hypothetical protein